MRQRQEVSTQFYKITKNNFSLHLGTRKMSRRHIFINKYNFFLVKKNETSQQPHHQPEKNYEVFQKKKHNIFDAHTNKRPKDQVTGMK